MQLKTINTYYLTVSVGAGFGSSSADWFWLQVSDEAVIRGLVGAVVSPEILTGAGGAASKMAHALLLAKSLSSLLADGRRARFLAMWVSP